MQNILSVNAHLKYVEFLLHSFDNAPDDSTIGDLKKNFKTKFNTLHPLLNQNFGIYRLLPLILMKETYKNQKVALTGDIKRIKVIRDAVAHDNFSIDEQGYSFQNEKHTVSFTYTEFNDFLHRVENQFYAKNSD